MAHDTVTALLERQIRDATVRCGEWRIANNTERYTEDFGLLEALELQLKNHLLARGPTPAA